MEQLTGNRVTVELLKTEIESSNETRKLLHKLYDLRKMDITPISGVGVLKVMQKQYFLSTEEFKKVIHMPISKAKQVRVDWTHKSRIMISGCPMSGGNTKVPEIIESKGGVIVAEESCTGTRSFW